MEREEVLVFGCTVGRLLFLITYCIFYEELKASNANLVEMQINWKCFTH